MVTVTETTVATSPPAAARQAILDQYEQGKYLQAYALAQQYGSIRDWKESAARVLGARLARNLGAPRLSHWHLLRAWREDSSNAEVAYYHMLDLFEYRGPYAAWLFLRNRAEPHDAGPDLHSSWLAALAHASALLRDFDAADQFLSRAETIAPQSAWVAIERASVMELEDRYEDALAAARRALELRPWYRPAVQSAAHLLSLRDRDDEALELLTEATSRTESGLLTAQLAALQDELGQFDAAIKTLDRYAELSPLREKEVSQWLDARRSDLAYRQGDFKAAIELAQRAGNEFHKRVGESMAQASAAARRVVLPVGFVRQHHQTCVPATLAAVSRFWSMPADHLQVAEQICYNGTSSYSERRWATENGWAAREFRITWDAAATLLDRGIPFTLTTVSPVSSHLQAVIGYDERRGTLLIRDPYQRHSGECLAQPLFESHRASGPRGMALVPVAERTRLESLELPDANLWDRVHQLDGALVGHDRAAAAAIQQSMQADAPGHWLTLEARLRLAHYDANPSDRVAALDQMLELFPDDECLQLARLAGLRELSRRDERLAAFRSICAKPKVSPVFWQQYAQELVSDASERPMAIRLLRRAIRYSPLSAGNYYVLANVTWDERRFEEATDLYRIAACLDDKDENLARAYFTAARYLRQTDQALEFLRGRFARLGKKSSMPARTLFWALDMLDRRHEALTLLDEAIGLRGDDGELLLFAADFLAGSGAVSRSSERLEQARGKVAEAQWLRSAAWQAWLSGRHGESLAMYQQVLTLQPFAIDAHRATAALLAETQGRAVALQHLESAVNQSPHHYGLFQLWIEWMREEPDDDAEPIVRRFVDTHPGDAWGRRELGMVLCRLRRFDEALAEARIAFRLDPTNPSGFGLRGEILLGQGKIDQAKAAFQDAVRLSVDYDYAITQLIACCGTIEERREVLAFVNQELVRQVIFGDGLLAFSRHAEGTLQADDLLGSLREAWAARPDLWHAWSALIQLLVSQNLLDEAWDLARQASQRFPLLPRIWLDRAAVCRARMDRAGEIEALEHALEINPSWGLAVRTLAEVYQRGGDFAKSRTLLEQAVARSPRDGYNLGCLADVLWRMGECEAALTAVERAIALEPGYEWAWAALRSWSQELGRPDQSVAMARELTRRRGGEPRSWLILARTLTGTRDLAERLNALDRAEALSPRWIEVHDMRASLLAEARRFDEALAACQPATWHGRLPVALRGRKAWIEAARGDRYKAIELMEEIVAEEPDYFWGWQCLAEWYGATGAAAQYLAAASQLVRIAPHSAISYGFRGHAKLQNQDRRGAKEDLQRAMALDPAYEWAGMMLFDLQREDSDWDNAAITLQALETHIAGAYVTARRAQLACALRDFTTAEAALRHLCISSAQDRWPISAAVEAMQQALRPATARTILHEAMGQPDAHPETASLWIRVGAQEREWVSGRMVFALLSRGDLGRRAAATYLELLGRFRRHFRLRWFIWRHARELRADTFLWGSVAYALTFPRYYRRIIRWACDWRARADAQPWMLANVVEAMRHCKDDRTAAEVSRHALTLDPDHGTAVHRLWLAVDQALDGDAETARSLLLQVDRSVLQADDLFMAGVIDAVLEMRTALPESRESVFLAVRGRLRASVRQNAQLLRYDRLRRRIYRSGVRRIARERGGLAAFAWGLWCRLVH